MQHTHRHPRRLWSILLTFVALLGAGGMAQAQVVYTYDAAPVISIPEDGGQANCRAPSGLTRSVDIPFTVTDTFTVGDVALGVDISHNRRGQIQIQIDPPGATGFTTVLPTSTDTDDNYRIMLSSNTEGLADDGDDDVAGAAVRYRRLVTRSGTGLTGGAANGTWTVRVCDLDNQGNLGTLNSVRLVLRNNAGTAAASCGTKSTYNWGTNGNENAFSSATIKGITFSEASNSNNPIDDSVNGLRSFTTRTEERGADDDGHYAFWFDLTGDPEPTGVEWTVFNFAVPVHGLSFSTLDIDLSNFEDYVRVEGFADTGLTTQVPRQAVNQNAQLSYAGDWIEADSLADEPTTDGNTLWTFTQPVSALRVTYAAGDQPDDDPSNQAIGIGDMSYCAFDFGDAPDSYNTDYAGTLGPHHIMGARSVYMGTIPDGETDAVPGGLADSDGADENGSLTLPTKVGAHFECARDDVAGNYVTAVGEFCVTVNVTNASGSGAQLVGWLDANGNGNFNDANERSIPRLGGYTSGNSGDATFTTANVPTGTSSRRRVLVWSGLTGTVTMAETYLRLRITTDASFMSDASPQPNGLASDGEVEDHRLPPNTLPVTLASVQSTVTSGGLDLRFSTASETDNVGFTIEEKTGERWQVLHDLVASAASNSAEPQAYSVRLSTLPASGAFYIVDHDARGRRQEHGPFAVGARVGQDLSADRFNWSATARAVEQARTMGTVSNAGKLWVSEPGFHRVTAAQLATAGVQLVGVPVEQIAVTFRGQGVPRRVMPDTGTFAAGSYIDFPASAATSLYTREFPYIVRGDGVGVIVIDRNERAANAEESAWYWAESTFAPDLIYNHSSPTADPWFAVSLLGRPGLPVSHAQALGVTAVAADSGEFSELSVDLAGVTNWDGGEADHHVQLQVNGQTVADERFDGAVANRFLARMPLFADGNLDVSVVVPGDTGFAFDLNHLDAMRLRYPRQAHADGERLWIDALQSSTAFFSEGAGDGFSDAHLVSGFEGPDQVIGFRVDGLADGEVFAYVGRGDDWDWLPQVASASGGSALVPSDSGSAYWVSNASGLHVPRVESLADAAALISGQADYLIISPPVFLDELQSLVNLQQSRGLTTRVVNLQTIYDQYNHSVPEAVAIQRYLDAAVPALGVHYVLLVGGDTYDYKNFLGTGSISLLPTQYTKVGDIITFAPVDALYADADRDGAPEFALGRLPVRSLAELQASLAKLAAVNGPVTNRKLMMVAQLADDEADYDSISDAFAAQLTDPWTTTRAYADVIGVPATRSSLLGALNSDYNLLTFVGHSASVQWSFDPILTSADIANTTGSPVDLVVQWGCWNSYFVSPSANTLAHKFLNTASHGASAVIGVTSLTEVSSHEALGAYLYPELVAGTRIGDAFRLAKMQLAAAEGSTYLDILLTATLLGDPAQPVR